jgi:hypothetical protein
MNVFPSLARAIPVGLLTCTLLGGCARGHLETTGNTASKPDNTTAVTPTATFTVIATGTAPLTYQWYVGTNAPLATNSTSGVTVIGAPITFTVTATGTTPFTYQWYIGTNTLSATNR